MRQALPGLSARHSTEPASSLFRLLPNLTKATSLPMTTRHEKYYFEDGNVIFRVSGRSLFNRVASTYITGPRLAISCSRSIDELSWAVE